MAVTATLRENVRARDIACRPGGEEMLIVLPECGLAHGLQRAESLSLAIAALQIRSNGQTLKATASFGVASYPGHGRAAESLVHGGSAAVPAVLQQADPIFVEKSVQFGTRKYRNRCTARDHVDPVK